MFHIQTLVFKKFMVRYSGTSVIRIEIRLRYVHTVRTLHIELDGNMELFILRYGCKTK